MQQYRHHITQVGDSGNNTIVVLSNRYKFKNKQSCAFVHNVSTDVDHRWQGGGGEGPHGKSESPPVYVLELE